MDPALCKLLEEGAADDEVSVILRLADPDRPPERTRLVAQFGAIATARVRRADIRRVRLDPATLSLKAPRYYSADVEPGGAEHLPPAAEDERRPAGIGATGRGVVVGMLDWGCDFAHPDLRHPDGRTRLLALWDQRECRRAAVSRYGYGRVFGAGDIDAALRETDPYAALDYHPADFDGGLGAHGTHTLGIAIGNGRAGGPMGVAPEADCVFVSLGRKLGPDGSLLGDSTELLEGLDFIERIAGDRPCVVNMSLGRHAGEHTGRSLLEQAMDHWLSIKPGRAIVQSCGNYFLRRAHGFRLLRPGETCRFRVEVDPDDASTTELDFWYPGSDRLSITLAAIGSSLERRAALGEQATLRHENTAVARIHHRRNDPNNGDNQCSVSIEPSRAFRHWEVALLAEDVVDGRVHVWLERDSGCPSCHSRFPEDQVDSRSTLGTICNGLRTIAVGAYDSLSDERRVARFSGSGPTRDGRQKPDLVAPGVLVLAARSCTKQAGRGFYSRMSGTSMGAPHVAGTIALMFEASQRKLAIAETRRALLSSCHPATGDPVRVGSGYLNTLRAVDAARRQGTQPWDAEYKEEEPMNEPLPDTVRRTRVCNDISEVASLTTRLFRVTAKSFIGRIGDRVGTLPGPTTEFALRALAAATDLAFLEDPKHDRVFMAPPPESKGYRLFSTGTLRVIHCGVELLCLGLKGGLELDTGKQAFPRVTGYLSAPPGILELPFAVTRLDQSRIRFQWGMKARPPADAEDCYQAIRARSSVYIWHRVKGIVDCSSGVPTLSSLTIEGSRFPSHRVWLDGAVCDEAAQGELAELWNADPADPTRVA